MAKTKRPVYMISVVADMFGVHPQTLRAYEREGLLRPARTDGNTRLYSEEDLERIFDKFHRVTAADRVTGTGLGLSICKGIIEAHGGKIWAENQPCCFEFHFILPLTLDGALPNIPKEAGNG